MAFSYTTLFSKKVTPQSEQAKPEQVENNAGGFVFAVDDWTRLDRFLIQGSDENTYYVKAKTLTKENAAAVARCLDANALKTVNRIMIVSAEGRAPKNDPAIFALAIAASHKDENTRRLALAALPNVARTGTHLFQFVHACNEMRGWGRGLRNAVNSWYTLKSVKDAAYQCLKYQQREGWSHRDLMRLSHFSVVAKTPAYAKYADLYHWVKFQGWDTVGEAPHSDEALQQIWAFERLKRTPQPKLAVQFIQDYRLTREMIPSELLNDLTVWAALLEKMPLTALIRSLAKMTAIGLLAPLSEATKLVCEKLLNQAYLKSSRVHPLKVLVALKTYQAGHGDKGSLSWTPVQQVVDVLDAAFYLSFGNVPVTNKRWFFGLDVSASMGAACSGESSLSCCEGATALSLVSSRVEANSVSARFNEGIEYMPFGAHTSLAQALEFTRSINGGGTDCSLPMIKAAQEKIPVDVFVVLTDSETWAGKIHPFQALKEYRQKMGIGAKLAVVGMASNGFSIADPSDAGMKDFVGFDCSVPSVLADYATGGRVTNLPVEDES